MELMERGYQSRARQTRSRRGPSAARTVYEGLRESVISLELPPDTALSRTALCERFRVSQTPVREAILRLEQEGLVKSIPQSKTVVTRIDVAQLREAHFLRTALEVEIGRALALAETPEKLDEAAAVLDAQRALGAGVREQATFARLDREFHDLLYAAAGHSDLADLVRERSGHLDRLRRLHLPSPGKMTSILREHTEILAAIRSGDPEHAAAAIRTHLTGTITTINRLIEASPDFFARRD